MKNKLLMVAVLLFSTVSFATPKVDLKANKKVKIIEHVDLENKPIIMLKGDVNTTNIDHLLKELESLVIEGGEKEIHFIINSYGGSVFDGLKLTNMIQAYKNQKKLTKLNCYIVENAYSMAAVISSFCDSLGIQETADFMHHQISTNLRGNVESIQKELDYMQSLADVMAKKTAKNYGLTLEEYKEFEAQELFLMSQDAASHGFVGYVFDSIYFIAPEMPEKQSTFDFLF